MNIEQIKHLLDSSDIVSCWDPDTVITTEDSDGQHSTQLTNPPHYCVLTHVEYNSTTVIGLFPNIDPRNPEEKTSNIALSPINLTHEKLVSIFDALNEIKPAEVVNIEIIHLTKEQLAILVACELDQDRLFNFIYSTEKEPNKCFNIVSPVKIIRSLEDIKGKEDEILPKQYCIYSKES